MNDLRKQRYDMAALPHDAHSRDPSLILGAVKQLVAARGKIGDLIIVHTPPGTASEVMHYLSAQLEARDGPIPPGLPGGPAL